MTPRSFWLIVFRLIGIWFLLKSVRIVYELISVFALTRNYDENSYYFTAILFSVLLAGFFLFLTYLAIFRTEWIIDKLMIDKGFSEEHFNTGLHRSDILQVALIVMGGILLATNLPQLIVQLIQLFRAHAEVNFGNAPKSYNFEVIQAFNVVIAVLLMKESRRITAFIEKMRRKK